MRMVFTVSLPMSNHESGLVSSIKQAASHWSMMHWQSRYPVFILENRMTSYTFWDLIKPLHNHNIDSSYETVSLLKENEENQAIKNDPNNAKDWAAYPAFMQGMVRYASIMMGNIVPYGERNQYGENKKCSYHHVGFLIDPLTLTLLAPGVSSSLASSYYNALLSRIRNTTGSYQYKTWELRLLLSD